MKDPQARAAILRRIRRLKAGNLRPRKLWGSRAARLWVPVTAWGVKRTPAGVRFNGKLLRLHNREYLDQKVVVDGKEELRKLKAAKLVQDACGDWFLCVAMDFETTDAPAPREEVGIDLGLATLATTSDGDKLEAGRFYRDMEPRIASLQRNGHHRQAKLLHRRAVNRRKDAIHKFTTFIVAMYQIIIVGDVSSTKLARTWLAKAVLDSAWGMVKELLAAKSLKAGRQFEIVNEAYTSVTCSSCGKPTGPAGVGALSVREWACPGCGAQHDRDVNAARNILAARRGRLSA